MKSFENYEDKVVDLLLRAWVTLGLPFDCSAVREKDEGVIDVEALVVTSLIVLRRDRMVTDLPAWLIGFSGVLNHQKLKSMLKATREVYRKRILRNVEGSHFLAAPTSFKRLFRLDADAPHKMTETVQRRIEKLNSLENVSRASLMIHNRLLYGTGFRADVITLGQIPGLAVKGRELARLLCTNDSTISRILSDLRRCEFLDRDNEIIGEHEVYPGLFLSSQSIRNLCDIMDALAFDSLELRTHALDNLNLKKDAFSQALLTQIR